MNFHIGDRRTNWEHIVNNAYAMHQPCGRLSDGIVARFQPKSIRINRSLFSERRVDLKKRFEGGPVNGFF